MSAPPSAPLTDQALLNCADEPIRILGAIQLVERRGTAPDEGLAAPVAAPDRLREAAP
jgi:hypothetical protein